MEWAAAQLKAHKPLQDALTTYLDPLRQDPDTSGVTLPPGAPGGRLLQAFDPYDVDYAGTFLVAFVCYAPFASNAASPWDCKRTVRWYVGHAASLTGPVTWVSFGATLGTAPPVVSLPGSNAIGAIGTRGSICAAMRLVQAPDSLLQPAAEFDEAVVPVGLLTDMGTFTINQFVKTGRREKGGFSLRGYTTFEELVLAGTVTGADALNAPNAVWTSRAVVWQQPANTPMRMLFGLNACLEGKANDAKFAAAPRMPRQLGPLGVADEWANTVCFAAPNTFNMWDEITKVLRSTRRGAMRAGSAASAALPYVEAIQPLLGADSRAEAVGKIAAALLEGTATAGRVASKTSVTQRKGKAPVVRYSGGPAVTDAALELLLGKGVLAAGKRVRKARRRRK